MPPVRPSRRRHMARTPAVAGPMPTLNRFNFNGLPLELRLMILDFAIGNDAELLIVRPTSDRTQLKVEERDGNARAMTAFHRVEVSPPSPNRNRLLQINRQIRSFMLNQSPARFLGFDTQINGVAHFHRMRDILWIQDFPTLATFVTKQPPLPTLVSPPASSNSASMYNSGLYISSSSTQSVTSTGSGIPVTAAPSLANTQESLAAATERNRLVRHLAAPGTRIGEATLQRIATFVELDTLYLSRPPRQIDVEQQEVEDALRDRIFEAIEQNGRLTQGGIVFPRIRFLDAMFERSWVMALQPFIDNPPRPRSGYRVRL